jgi:hypothetical protein
MPVNPKSLNNLKPNARSQGKVRINLTLHPATIDELRNNYSSVSQGIEEILSKSVSVAQVDRLQKKLEKSEKDVNFFANKCSMLTSEILRLNEDPYSVHSKLEARCQELDHFNGCLDNKNRKLELENQNLKLELQNLKLEIEKLKSDNTHYQISEGINTRDEPEKDLSFDDSHEENYTSIQHDYCDFIKYERISESVNNEIILSSCDLIRATIYSPVKKPLIDIRKSLDLVLGRFDCKISKIAETFGLDKSKKWAFKFECFDAEMSLKCLESVKKELSEQV